MKSRMVNSSDQGMSVRSVDPECSLPNIKIGFLVVVVDTLSSRSDFVIENLPTYPFSIVFTGLALILMKKTF